MEGTGASRNHVITYLLDHLTLGFRWVDCTRAGFGLSRLPGAARPRPPTYSIDFYRCPMANKSSPRNETTSARAATAASKVLSNPKSSAAAKTAAASALTQRAPTKNK